MQFINIRQCKDKTKEIFVVVHYYERTNSYECYSLKGQCHFEVTSDYIIKNSKNYNFGNILEQVTDYMFKSHGYKNLTLTTLTTIKRFSEK